MKKRSISLNPNSPIILDEDLKNYQHRPEHVVTMVTDPSDDNPPQSSTSQSISQPTNSTNNADNSKKIQEHLMTIEQVLRKYDTSSRIGLDDEEVLKRLQRDGLNRFTPPKTKPWYLLFLKELTGGFALLLWFAGIATIASYFYSTDPDHKNNLENIYLGVSLILVVLITGMFSFYQQMSSSKVFESFKEMTPQSTLVLRNGKKQQMDVEQLVVGDIVYCQAGDRIPADIRLIESEGMKVDNSSITGESEPLLRTTDPVDGPALEASNLAFFSTNCTDGNGIGIVIGTGDRTIIGDLASIVSSIKDQKTPIAKEISSFVNIIFIIAVISGGIFFLIFWQKFKTSLMTAFILMIGITVGNVPEGLLPALTVVLTVAAKRMASKKCLVKHLEAVETLGSTSVICTDKTGTLTQNRMTVEHLWFGEKTYENRDKKLLPNEDDNQQLIKNQLDWLALKRCAMLCSRAEFLDDNPSIKDRKTMGDASESAIMKFLEESIGPVQEYRQLYPKVAEKPFNSINKYQFSIHRKSNPIDGKFSNYFLVMKGAPERILEKCKWRLNQNGQPVLIDQNFINSFEDAYRYYGSNGERVLAFCDLEFTTEQFPEDFNFHSLNLDDGLKLEQLRFLGLISLIDPPRPDVPNAVRLCRKAGIRVVMVTGDHPITAQAIAKMCGIISASHRGMSIVSLMSTYSEYENQRSIVIPGNELDEMTDEELQDKLDFGEIVFARTSPKQKLRVVKQFQQKGEIVAVTGDGVNDSLALKKADIGIAMGITGSEVSKQAADMILLDDNFATIVLGVEEGRRIFDNLKKTISYILAGNVTTIYPFILNATMGIPLAMSTPIALLIALGTDMIPAISLAYEKSESDIMNIPPRNSKKDRMVNGRLMERSYLTVGLIITFGAYFSYFVSMANNGYLPWDLWNSRTRWNDRNDTFPHYSHLNKTMVPTTYQERKEILYEAQSAYFAGIIVMQWMDVIVCKTRRVSIFKHGMSNWILNLSIIFETILASIFIYIKLFNTVMLTREVGWKPWVWALPFLIFLLFYEELRKFIIRKFPRSTLGKELLA